LIISINFSAHLHCRSVNDVNAPAIAATTSSTVVFAVAMTIAVIAVAAMAAQRKLLPRVECPSDATAAETTI
jgi:hypothetical protein